jgi:hypothetical protein
MKKDRYADTLRPEYTLADFSGKGVRGKYSGRILKGGTHLVLLDPDVAKAFPTSAEVNEALRSLARARQLRRRSVPRMRRKRAEA